MGKKPIDVEVLTHDRATRKNIPTAEFESVMRQEEKEALRVAYERPIPWDASGPGAKRERDLDPQFVWRGKDEQDASDLIASAPPLYIQEKVHPKVLIDDLRRETAKRKAEAQPKTLDLFADFNGLDLEAKTEFYQHDQHWSNRMIVGDSLSVMASLAEREGLRGQVQCIYIDPPYGIKFNSNFQWSTTSRDVKDGAKDQITREPEQVRAFRDTWRDGIHSYLSYLRDRLTMARDLLSESGSIFVQIGDENVHRVRAVMDEVFGDGNFVSLIAFKKTTSLTSEFLSNNFDYLVWYARSRPQLKYRSILVDKGYESDLSFYQYFEERIGDRRKLNSGETGDPDKLYSVGDLTSSHDYSLGRVEFQFQGRKFSPGRRFWTTSPNGMGRLARSSRIHESENSVRFVRFMRDYPVQPLAATWVDTVTGQYSDPRLYVVQTATKVIQRCILMTTDPGDLVLDPTCGSGTTATVAEQWGRRWITIDTSRVAVALARSRLMGARYPYYLLADSPEGQLKEAEVTRTPPKTIATRGDLRLGFVYERVPHITLKSIANNAEIDVIWEKWQETLEPVRAKLNAALGKSWQEWAIPRDADSKWPDGAKTLHAKWWEARIERQKEIDASIAAKAEFEYLYDKPYVDNSRIRVAGPFTVESLSPHRTLAVDWDDELIDTLEAAEGKRKRDGLDPDKAIEDFAQMILENLKAAGVQQAQKEDRIAFTSLAGWPGRYICAIGEFMEGEKPRRAGIFVGPEFGTVSRPDLVAAAREAGDAGFDVLIACAFNYDAHSAEFDKLGRVPVLKARMNPDLHMGADLKATGAGNLFVIFGEPDIRIDTLKDGHLQVKVFGVDVFKPQTGEVMSEGTDGIALWMLDDDYNEESFFVRHAYFLGANDPYKALKTTLKAEIDEEAWSSLYSDTSRPFEKPKSGRIAVKVINHLGDEVMKVFSVG
jgi:adenine-specific DNA-methyltransferase